jgi:hypothetical protein
MHSSGNESADEAVAALLRSMEREMDLFGSALPENENRPPHHLVVTRVDEHDFGWVYFYNSKAFAETGDFEHGLIGNAPVIVDRRDCALYATGTARPIEHYVQEFRMGTRHPLQRHTALPQSTADT